jgi:hypothetical protein
MIVDGPSEPKAVESLLRLWVDELKALAPLPAARRVELCPANPYGALPPPPRDSRASTLYVGLAIAHY